MSNGKNVIWEKCQMGPIPEKHYEEIFNSIINIITINHCIEININSIVI